MTSHPPSHLLSLTGVTRVFGNGAHAVIAVSDASFCLRPGECVLLLGPSGSGKTTLLTVAAGLTPATGGSVELLGRPLREYQQKELQRIRASHIGFVFQAYRLLDPLTVLENTILAARFAGASRSTARQSAERVLSDLRIAHLASSYPTHLSQGEKQRVATARALVNEPKLIIADEPTASLESSQAILLVKLLLDYVHARQAGLLVATHDLRLVKYADRILRIEDGKLTELADPAQWPVQAG